MKRLHLIILMLIFIGCQRQTFQPQWNLTHTAPAQIWEECYPLGNGHLGMMPDGGVEKETIVLNDITLWSGAPSDDSNPLALQSLPEIQRLLKEGKNDEAAKDVCMHAAAMHPEYLNRDQIPAEVIAKEREIQLAAMANDPKNAGKPESILNKIIDGKINAFFKANCLVDQEFVKDSSLSVGAYSKNNGIAVTQYVNWTLGAK